MNARIALLGAALTIAIAAPVGWMLLGPGDSDGTGIANASEPEAAMPEPPVPPRIATGEDYERCLAMLQNDPDGANAFADAWEATGGGEGAAHCHALAQIALGETATGAGMLEKLAHDSKAPPLARAQVYGQAVQAWLMADDPARAHDAASAAIALSPNDAELYIDRSIALATAGRYLDAIDDLNQALVLDPRRADALTFRAAAWRHEDKLDRAQDDIDRALDIDPDSAEALLERGIIRQRRNDMAGAEQDWRRAMTLAPDSATADLAQQNLALLEAGPSQR
jgi:tetratricopeptide (TPR) repeat protein